MNTEQHVLKIAQQLQVRPAQVAATVALLDEDATVPFISRYRKEVTGSLDEVAIAAIRDTLEQLRELDKRRQAIIDSMTKLEVLTDALKAKIDAAQTLTVLEDIYLPFRPKRRTRATIAKEKGLEALAKLIFEQSEFDVSVKATEFINKEKEVTTADEALAGARDIIAEWISEDQQARASIRNLFQNEGILSSKVIASKEEQAAKYKDYFDLQETASKAPSHRVLAVRRGAKEKLLIMRIEISEEKAGQILQAQFVKNSSQSAMQIKAAIADGYKRLMAPSMETEMRLTTKKTADEEAIRIFVENLRQLLLSSPLGQKSVLAIDPGFRTGCKVVCLDRQGKLLHNDTIFPHTRKNNIEYVEKIKALCKKFNIEAVAIGNGTAGRETEEFVKSIGLAKEILITMVSENGASVYSASPVAREEFPDRDVTVRGSVSIGRRLMDPLAELVKIDPKSIGVGQYQHDVDQKLLKKSLDDTVQSCVNMVGVEANTASKQLLTYVSGLRASLAENIVAFRDSNGAFKSREELKKVSGMGDKTFQQCAGFLRIANSGNPLDKSAVHPESYHIVAKMAGDLGCGVDEMINDKQLVQKIDIRKYVSDGVGLPTLQDITSELEKPGRDPREKFDAFSFAEGINKPEDLEVGMKLPGIVTNITAFGAFVDVGVHQDGLVHISQMADKFVSDPADVVKVHQQVSVTVMEIDLARNRIALSMKSEKGETKQKKKTDRPAKKNAKPVTKSNAPKVDSNKPLAQQLTFGS